MSSINKIKIAVIEDEASIRSMYCFKLSYENYEVKSAENGKLGLELVEKFSPDLILLDLKMPVLGGADMLKQMRAQNWGAKPRVIILTNLNKGEAPSSLRFLGVDRYIVKAHHTPAQLLEVIKEVLNQKT